MATPLIITVLQGGPGSEREVSLRSGAACAAALRSLGHTVHVVDPVPGRLALAPGTQVVFLALHGAYGEDGTVQAELEDLNVPYTGCGVQASRIAFDKLEAKAQFVKQRIPTPRARVLCPTNRAWPAGWLPPVVLKPVRQGSSVGLHFVDRLEEFPAALDDSLRYDAQVLMEERVLGREVTVGILNGRALPVVEVRPRRGAYDYANKYTAGATEYFCPADFDPAVTARIQELALGAFQAVEGRDYARVDVMVFPDGTPVVLEVNTLPGMTETSLLPKAAAAAGIAFPQLCQQMVDLAMQRSPRRP